MSEEQKPTKDTSTLKCGGYWNEQKCAYCLVVIREHSENHACEGPLDENVACSDLLEKRLCAKCPNTAKQNSSFCGPCKRSTFPAPPQSGISPPSPPLEPIEPFKRQVSWATPLSTPPYSCGLCGAEVSHDSFCISCHLKQRRLVLQSMAEDATKQKEEAQSRCFLIARELESNRIASEGLVIVHTEK